MPSHDGDSAHFARPLRGSDARGLVRPARLAPWRGDLGVSCPDPFRRYPCYAPARATVRAPCDVAKIRHGEATAALRPRRSSPPGAARDPPGDGLADSSDAAARAGSPECADRAEAARA